MRIAWWEVIVIGAVLVGVGGYAVLASQNEMNYIKSCERPVACGGPGQGNLTSRAFLTSAQTASLQEAQLGWAVGIGVLALGLVSASYGIYLYLNRGPSPLVHTGATSVQH